MLVLYLGLSPGVPHAVHGPGKPLALADVPGGGEEGEHPGQQLLLAYTALTNHVATFTLCSVV